MQAMSRSQPAARFHASPSAESDPVIAHESGAEVDMPAWWTPSGIYRDALSKTIFDRICAAAGLLILSPFLALLAFAIACDDGFPVLFRQKRVGRGGSLFDLVKFR